MKKYFKKFILFFLVLSMMFSMLTGFTASASALFGFSRKNEKEKPADEMKASVTSPEFTYTSAYSTLDVDTDEYVSILHFNDNGFFCTYDEVVGEEIPEGVIPEYEGQYYIREPRLMFITYNGEISKISGYKATERPQGGEDQYSYYSSVFLNSLTESADGKLFVIEGVNEGWSKVDGLSYDDPSYWDNQVYSMTYYLRELNPDGTEISSCCIPTSEDEYISSTIILDADGNFILGSGNGIRAVGTDGKDIYTVDAGNYVDSVARTPDGSIYVSTYSQNGFNALRKLDAESKTLGEEITIPFDAYSFYSGGGDYSLYYTSGQYFYGLNPETGEAEKIFDWIAMDINPDDLGNIGILSDGTIVGINTTFSSATQSFSFEKFEISKIPYSEAPQKTVLKLATIGLGYDTKKIIVKFNRANPDFRIEVTDYSQYNTNEDISAGLTKLTTELTAGNYPDILELSGLPVTQLAAKGILEDLYPYMDSDPTINRTDFFPNVLASQEKNGKLISTVSGFSISAVTGASSLVGEESGWTYDEFLAALAELRDSVPEADPFDAYTTRDTILSTCLSLDMDKYVDWSTGKCSFDTPEFISLLEFANTFPESFDFDDYDWSSSDTTVEYRTSAGLQMLVTSSFYSFDDIFFLNGFFDGEEQTFIGYPTSDGTPGNFIDVATGLAMTSKSEHKDAVWKFLRNFFTAEYQKDNYYLPSCKALFDERLAEAMTISYQKTSSGNYQLDENGEKIPVARMGIYDAGGKLHYFYALSEKQAEQIREIVSSTTKVRSYNDSISEIVNEQAAAYFSGQKSAQDVAKLIQSKANIYVNEQR